MIRLLAILLTTNLSLGVTASPERHQWTIPGTLRIGLISEPNTLNPVIATQVAEGLITGAIFNGLLRTHVDGSQSPDLATIVPSKANGGISSDGKTIVFHLRHGVRWQDGEPFTSLDVAFTQAAQTNPANDVTSRYPYDQVHRVETPDPYTVVFRLRKPFASFLATYGGSAILPAHLLAKFSNLNRVAFNEAPIGTGPFVFDHWTRSQEVVLRANDNYFAGRPRLRTIIYRLLADSNNAGMSLRAHELDALFQPQPTVLDMAETLDGVNVIGFAANAFEHVGFNTTSPPLDDVRIRQAISLAIDRRILASKAMDDRVLPANGPLPTFMWAANPAVHLPYDPERSRELLSAAGYAPGSDGIAVKGADRLSLLFLVPAGDATTANAALLIQAMLRDVGIETTIKSAQPNLMYAPYAAGGLLERGEFQLEISRLFSAGDPDLSRAIGCDYRPPNGFNVSRYCNQEVDRLEDAGERTYDQAKRRRYYAQVQEILLRDAPEAFLWWPRQFVVINTDLHGFEDAAHHDMAPAEEWSI